MLRAIEVHIRPALTWVRNIWPAMEWLRTTSARLRCFSDLAMGATPEAVLCWVVCTRWRGAECQRTLVVPWSCIEWLAMLAAVWAVTTLANFMRLAMESQRTWQKRLRFISSPAMKAKPWVALRQATCIGRGKG